MVLFDLDGTVANTIPLILASYEHATKSVLGRAASAEESRTWIGQTLLDTFRRRYPDHVDELMDAYLTWNLAHLERLVQPYDGMDALLADLRAAGVVTGIVTSKRRASAERTLAAVGLAGAIDIVGTMEDAERHKPDPEPLARALAKLGRRPDEAVYVGDAAVDLQAARAVGASGIGVTWGAGLRAELDAHRPVAVVDTVDALRSLLLAAG